MDQARNYLPYTIGIVRWGIFLLLKVVPAIFYRPYTSKTLERDIKRHNLLMKRGMYLCLRTGLLCLLYGGILGLALGNLISWLMDKEVYEQNDIKTNMYRSLMVGGYPGAAVLFIFAIFIENMNIRTRKSLMSSIRDHHQVNSGDEMNDDPDCLADPNPFTPSDVTVVVPVYEPPPAFKANIISLLVNNPAKILIVADVTCVTKVQTIIDSLLEEASDIVGQSSTDRVRVVPESRPGKRAALSTGLRHVQTRLTCFVDDDCQWCSESYLTELIKPFDNRTIGGVGCKQIMRPSESDPSQEGGEPILCKANILEVMADFRLSVRYIDLMATTAVDRGASCISGRTMCFLTSAISSEEFHHAFMNESLAGIHLLSGDDKFLTRYIIKKGYKTYHQLQPGCMLTTTFEKGRKKHMSQIIRWSRNTWRSDITALFIERKIWSNDPFTAFLLFDKLFTPFFLLYGLVIIPVYSLLRMDWSIIVAWLIWLYFSRALKLSLHFYRRPDHIVYLPIWIMYQYMLGFVRMYALVTMLKTHWGNRAVSVVGGKVVRTGPLDETASQGQVSSITRANGNARRTPSWLQEHGFAYSVTDDDYNDFLDSLYGSSDAYGD